ncbi:YitT family protein [Planococcus sp. N028]|uniref:YitT family protein n=1 Tax=Planococcus shixiaomingii TaxID=3058393 RepID=A0ABT8N1U4_9BACL|nr:MULTISPECIES: YitT family protein [unclassified Planococcus (in: firmicutes)]MDN7241862.1 YitT family protein [Planococcus sp. N028]WKA54148.1 YitT family protein [Planococcus sp. N022]
MRRSLYYRWLFFISGLIVMALGFTLTIKGNKLGIGPWDVLHVGLFLNFGLTIGTWAIIAGFVIIVVTALLTRRIPQIGTFLNMLLVGVFIDIFNFLIPDIETLLGQIIIFTLGIILSGIGIGFYVAPKIGAGPRDSLMLFFVEKTGLSISIVRASLEVSVALVGWMLGGPVGIGTIAVALITGRIVQFSLPWFEKALKKIIEKKNDVPPVLKI